MLRLVIDSRPDNPYRTDIIQSVLRGAFLGLCHALEQRLPEITPSRHTHADSLFDEFLKLLNQRKTKACTVEMCASDLCVSAKYLSAICKKNSGKTAREWIREQLLEEIRYYLKQTDLSMKQIADQLGFANASFFGKYVKEHFGMTPAQFRISNTDSQK